MTKLEIRNSKFAGASRPGTAQVTDFTDLQVWRLARELRKLVCGLVRNFPGEEKFALSDQITR
jgi:hypothetical protein